MYTFAYVGKKNVYKISGYQFIHDKVLQSQSAINFFIVVFRKLLDKRIFVYICIFHQKMMNHYLIRIGKNNAISSGLI